MSKLKFSLILFSLLTLPLAAIITFRVFSASATNLSTAELNTITQNCATIRQSLKNLQKADSYTRVLLGADYQALITRFMTNLNLRLIKENRPNPSLTDLHSDFLVAKNNFSQDFIKYSQALEELTTFDCVSSPGEFYSKLENTRTKRQTLSNSAAKLLSLTKKHLSLVKELAKNYD